MDIASLLREHVYTAILLGGVIEGETAVVLAGFAAHQGYVSLWAVIVLAAVSNFCCDQGYYALGRWRGAWLLVRLPRLRPMVERMLPQLDRHRRWLIFSVRFMYGLRTVGPLALGVARVRSPCTLASVDSRVSVITGSGEACRRETPCHGYRGFLRSPIRARAY